MLRAVLALTISLVLLLYSVKTFKRNLDWGDSLLLAESAVPVNPSNAKVFMTIGNHYAQKVRMYMYVSEYTCTHPFTVMCCAADFMINTYVRMCPDMYV